MSDYANLKEKLSIKTSTLHPQEQRTSLKLLKSADTYQQIFVKYPRCGTFHSYAELLHAALLESDPCVEMFIPKPFRFTIGPSPYVPDCYLVRQGVRIVRELRSKAAFPKEWRIPLQEFLAKRGMRFEVIANQDIYARETEALNWLQIVQTLISGGSQDTSQLEVELCHKIARAGGLTLIEVIPEDDKFLGFATLLALYRLLHHGEIKANLCSEAIHYGTEFKYVADMA